ncbi:MAG: GNAT family N-acetyltransferase [Candidatus Nanopelagicales bacterium]
MTVSLRTPLSADLPDLLEALGRWQRDAAPVQLHPGDVGWFQRLGEAALLEALRGWWLEGRLVAVALLDGAEVARLAQAPALWGDRALADRVGADLADPDRGVLGEGRVSVEAPAGSAVRDALAALGWEPGEPWTPLRRDLAEPVEDSGLHIEVVGPSRVEARVAVQRAAFDSSTFSAERWEAMAEGPAYTDARCLLGHDADGTPVAAATVWSAGLGHPGLLEPVGVHRDHRGRGHGAAISRAAAATLRELGSSSAVVCTRSSNAAAVATYRAAGFTEGPAVPDLTRPT